MDPKTELWNQYQILRDEIKSIETLNTQILGATVGAVAAILVAGFSRTDPLSKCFVFVCAYVITIPAYELLWVNRRRTWRITTYMRVFLEPQFEHIKWETRLHEERILAKQRLASQESKQTRQPFSTFILKSERSLFILINTVVAIAVVGGVIQYALMMFGGVAEYDVLVVARHIIAGMIFLVTVIGYVYLYRYIQGREESIRRIGEVEESYMKSWGRIGESEAKGKQKRSNRT